MSVDYYNDTQDQEVNVETLVRAKQILFWLSFSFIALFFAAAAYYNHVFHKPEWLLPMAKTIHDHTLLINFLLFPFAAIVNLFTFKNEVMAIFTITLLLTSFVLILYSFRRNATERQEAQGTLFFSSIAYIYGIFLALFVATGWVFDPNYLREIIRNIYIVGLIITVAPIAIRMLFTLVIIEQLP